jgi:hypothetical protein
MGPKYSADAKLPAIEGLLPATGTKKLDGIANATLGPNKMPTHLLIVGFDYDSNRAVFFRSAPAGGPSWGAGEPASVTLAEAVHASTNAPVNFFDGPALLPLDVDRYWDGGITGCNNPSLVAVVEAIALGQQPQSMHLLSLGTASVSLPLAAPGTASSPFTASRATSTLLVDLQKLATAILDDPPDAATFIAHAITGGSAGVDPPAISRVVRMSPLISPTPCASGWKPPEGMSAAAFQYMCGIGMDALLNFDITYINNYCTAWLEDYAPNQPIRPNGINFDPWTPELGYPKFSEAKAAWQQLSANATATPKV